MRCTVTRAVKVHGTRHQPGTVLDVTETEYAQLMKAGAIGAAPPPVQPVVKVPRTAQEKQAALDEAKQRLAKTTGHAVDAGYSGSETPPEPEP